MNKRYAIPGTGMRTIKTVISVAICLIFYGALGMEPPLYACIGAVISLQDTVENSISFGKARIMGTALGGALGVIFDALSNSFFDGKFRILFICAGTFFSISLSLLCRMPKSCAIACIVLFAVMFGDPTSVAADAVSRILETIFGISIAVAVNVLVKPVKRTEEE